MPTSIIPTTSYVKFLRGTPSAYQNLSPKDPNTLYYVYEANANHGVLYLGDKLISGSLSSATSLNDLTDITLSAGITEGSLLVYDGSTWVNRPLSDILEIIVGTMVGATDQLDGEAGIVPMPHAGDQNKYLRGDGTWANPTAALEVTVGSMQSQLGTLIGNDIGSSVRAIAANEVGKIVGNAPAAFDTLVEIADWIENHPESSDLAARVTTIENQLNTPNTGIIDQLDSAITDLNGVQSAVFNLQQTTNNQNVRITNLENSLVWQNMVENN